MLRLKGDVDMKLLINLQKILAILVLIIGFVFMISETPISEGLASQMWLTVGGACVIGISALWLWLISKEEGYFINETR